MIRVDSLRFLNVTMVELSTSGGHFVQVHGDNLRAVCPRLFPSQKHAEHRQWVDLTNMDDDIVDLFVQWIYYGPRDTLSPLAPDEAFMILAKLQVFADDWNVPRLKNDIIWQLFMLRREKRCPTMSVVEFAFRSMAASSTFRSILVDWFVWPLDSADSANLVTVDTLEKVPRFACEVVVKYQGKSSQDPFMKGPDGLYVAVVEEIQETASAEKSDDEWQKPATRDPKCYEQVTDEVARSGTPRSKGQQEEG